MRDNHTQISHITGGLSMNMSPWNKDRVIGHDHFDISYLGDPKKFELERKRAIWLYSMFRRHCH